MEIPLNAKGLRDCLGDLANESRAIVRLYGSRQAKSGNDII